MAVASVKHPCAAGMHDSTPGTTASSHQHVWLRRWHTQLALVATHSNRVVTSSACSYNTPARPLPV